MLRHGLSWMGHTLRLCSQCERQCSWYTQPQPPKLSMHGETCVPVLMHWLPVGHGSDGAKGPRPWRGTGGCERQEGGRGGRGGRRENGGGWNGRWGREAARREAGGGKSPRWRAIAVRKVGGGGGRRAYISGPAGTDRSGTRPLAVHSCMAKSVVCAAAACSCPAWSTRQGPPRRRWGAHRAASRHPCASRCHGQRPTRLRCRSSAARAGRREDAVCG